MSRFKTLNWCALAAAALTQPALADSPPPPLRGGDETRVEYPDYPRALGQARREGKPVVVFANLPPRPVPGMVVGVDRGNLLKVGPHAAGVCLFWYDPNRGWVSHWVDEADASDGGLRAEYDYRRGKRW